MKQEKTQEVKIMAEQGANKLEKIAELVESLTCALTHNAGIWTSFLDSAARMYISIRTTRVFAMFTVARQSTQNSL